MSPPPAPRSRLTARPPPSGPGWAAAAAPAAGRGSQVRPRHAIPHCAEHPGDASAAPTHQGATTATPDCNNLPGLARPPRQRREPPRHCALCCWDGFSRRLNSPGRWSSYALIPAGRNPWCGAWSGAWLTRGDRQRARSMGGGEALGPSSFPPTCMAFGVHFDACPNPASICLFVAGLSHKKSYQTSCPTLSATSLTDKGTSQQPAATRVQ